MEKRMRKIYKLFGRKLVGNDKMKYHVCEVLSFMEEEIIEYVTKNCWFFASFDDAWAFTSLVVI